MRTSLAPEATHLTPEASARRLLFVAFHYPPVGGSSGFHRTLAFSKYLAEFGWHTTVLTAHTRAYPRLNEANEKLIPPHVDVIRAPAIDASRHLAFRGWHPDLLALPDRWQSWIAGGILKGLAAIRRERPDAIVSTFPIASAHCIGLALHRLTGIPWVADFRDPMDQGTYPADPRVRGFYAWIERQVFRYADRVVVTTPGTAELYADRFGAAARERLEVIGNGFDPELFPPRSAVPAPRTARDGTLTLLHSGHLYPKERDPQPFFRALARLRASPDPALSRLRVVLRATGHDAVYRPMLARLGVADCVSLEPALPFREALQEMMDADALLLFQAANCNLQIPAKTYEYLHAGRPILGITDPAGDTGRLLATMGTRTIARLEQEDEIFAMLASAIPRIRADSIAPAAPEHVLALSRRARSEELAKLLDGLCAAPAPALTDSRA